MTKQFKEMILSKRVLAFLLSLIIFIVLVHTTTFGPAEIGGALTMLGGMYIAGETIRKSDKKE